MQVATLVTMLLTENVIMTSLLEKNASSSTNDNVAVDEIEKSNPSSKDVAVDKMDSDNAVYHFFIYIFYFKG